MNDKSIEEKLEEILRILKELQRPQEIHYHYHGGWQRYWYGTSGTTTTTWPPGPNG